MLHWRKLWTRSEPDRPPDGDGRRRKGMVRMDDKGEIVSSCDVDENIALQIWTKGFSPRLVVLNKNKNSRKLIHL